jgi:hypothetical protein
MVDSADNGEITEQLAARKLPYTTDVRGRAGRRQSSPDSPGPGVAPRPAQVLEAESQLLWAVVAASATRSGAFAAMSIRVANTATGSPALPEWSLLAPTRPITCQQLERELRGRPLRLQSVSEPQRVHRCIGCAPAMRMLRPD